MKYLSMIAQYGFPTDSRVQTEEDAIRWIKFLNTASIINLYKVLSTTEYYALGDITVSPWLDGADYDLLACLEYNPQESYNAANLLKVLAVWEGENDGDDWRWVLELTNYRFVFLRGGCDYTGWDCQSSAWSVFGESPEEVLALGCSAEDDREVHTELLIQLDNGKKKTWREKKDEELGHPKFL